MYTARLGKYEVAFADSVEFHAIKREIWGSHCYYVELSTDSPRILDIGGHIGLAALYFKTLFPTSEIDSYEPSSENVKLFETNLSWNNIKGVKINPVAVSTGETELLLHQNQDGGWLSTTSIFPGAWNESQQTTPKLFPALPLKTILSTKYDLIKMDVEGYEYELLKSVKDKLNTCPHWLIEVHGRGHYDIRELLALFEKEGFSTLLEKGGKKLKSHQLSGLALLHAVRGGATPKS